MSTVPHMVERHANLVDLSIKTKPDVRAYRISAADTLDNAFSSPNVMFTVRAGTTFRSPSVRSRRLGRVQDNNRGLTRVFYDPEDYWSGGGTFPHDADVSFISVEEQNFDETWRDAGPILIIPPAGFFNTSRPSLTVSGTAPALTARTNSLPPEGALHFVLPRYADTFRLQNLSAASGETLYGSPSKHLPEVDFHSADPSFFLDGTVSELLLRSDNADAEFRAYFAIVNGALE